MKKGFIITARLKSTRLKEKLSLKLLDRSVISWMIERAKLVFPPQNIVIATSGNPQDDALVEVAKEEGIKVFRGHEDDVIARLYEAATENNLDYFINITADCPLFGYDYVSSIFNLMEETGADLVTSLDLPHGIFVYGIKTNSIKKVFSIKKTTNTEVWGDYYYQNPELFKVEKLSVPEDKQRPDFRLTIDYPEDYEFFKALFNTFKNQTYKISSDELVKFLDQHPEIVNINKHCKALYQKRWEQQVATRLEKE